MALLVTLLETRPWITTVAFDVDGTLGPLPGWNGQVPLTEYVADPAKLQRLLQILDARLIRTVVVSRNGMFSTHLHPQGAEQILQMGFDDVKEGYRSELRVYTKVDEFPEPGRVLLIDDRESECRAAVGVGATAMWVHRPMLEALETGDYNVLEPSSPTIE